MALTRARMARIAFGVLIVACLAPLIVRSLLPDEGPSVLIERVDGALQTVTLADMKRRTVLTREGQYQNQYSNWRDQGIYSGVLVSDLMGDAAYSAVEAIAEDGYRVTIERDRIDDPAYPMVLAFGFDGVEVPAWEDGFRIAVLPEDGDVSNEEYGVESAGSYWVKEVVRLRVLP
jgi:hypothetical protein